MLKSALKRNPLTRGIYRKLNTKFVREQWVRDQLSALPAGARILDAGAGSQRYRQYCDHLDYRAQDFAQYERDEKEFLGNDAAPEFYQYGPLDYVGNVWAVDELAGQFDAILCTEVLEHIPYPIRALEEFARLLKPGGRLILTAPGNCLRHMDPYFFVSGYSDRWYERLLPEAGFALTSIEPVGDYYSWLAAEMARTGVSHSIFAKLLIFPALCYFLLKKATDRSIDTLCVGYHVLAVRNDRQLDPV